jgi:hypothetical protein
MEAIPTNSTATTTRVIVYAGLVAAAYAVVTIALATTGGWLAQATSTTVAHHGARAGSRGGAG